MESQRIQIDLYGDWVELLRHRLLRLGCMVSKQISPEKLPMVYFNVRKRLLEPHPRKVLKSAEFSCPNHLISGLDLLVEKVQSGMNLTPHMSTKIMTAEFNDFLLNDWRIHHFHLGRILQKDGFIKRTGPLLYAFVTDGNFYLLDVKGHDGLSCKHLLEILHINWPEIISRFRMNCKGMEYVPTDGEINKLRKACCSYSLEMSDGTVYFPIGGGYASSGMSDEAIRSADYYSGYMQWFEEYILENAAELARLAAAVGRPFGEELEFKLAIRDDWFRVVEKNSLVIFDLPRQEV